MLRELTTEEMKTISGGNANSGYEGSNGRNNSSSWSHMSQNAPSHIYSGPGTVECANGVFGALAKNFPNPVKMGIGVAKNAGKCLSNSNGGGRGALGGNSNANSVNGQCHW